LVGTWEKRKVSSRERSETETTKSRLSRFSEG
jgi:hypothetical protein